MNAQPTLADLWRGARDIGPIAALIGTIMAALYLGFASVSELAALGVLGAVLLVFYALLGMFLDGTYITVMTLPITLPLITATGFDPIWFGIFVVVAVEISQITPPIGFNLFGIQSQTGESIDNIARAALSFFFILLVFPDLAFWLPRTLQ